MAGFGFGATGWSLVEGEIAKMMLVVLVHISIPHRIWANIYAIWTDIYTLWAAAATTGHPIWTIARQSGTCTMGGLLKEGVQLITSVAHMCPQPFGAAATPFGAASTPVCVHNKVHHH